MVKTITIIGMLALSCTAFAQTDKECCKMITVVEQPPVFNGNLADFIQKNLIYPEIVLRDKIYGQVVVSFQIDTTGVTKEHTVMKGVHEELDKQALRVCRLIRFDKPAMQKGKPVVVTYTVPVNFIHQIH